MKYCALCCIACDEDRFLGEWLAYHAEIGFEHFIIYDDCSAAPISDLLGDLARPGQTTVIRHERKRDQISTYSRCLADFGARYRWIAFLDVDEFVRLGPIRRAASGKEGEPRSGRALFSDIRIFLSMYEPYASVGLNWRMFSSSGHDSRPPDPVIGAYTRCLGDDIHIKSIVQPAKIRSVATPHSFHPLAGCRAVNAARFTIPPGFAFTVPETAPAAVNHYYYKSRECFAEKVRRGNPCNIQRRTDEFERHLTLPVNSDVSLTAYAPLVSAALKAGRLPEAEPLAHLPAERPGEPPGGSMGSARAYLAEAANGNAPPLRQALLHLAYVSLFNDFGGGADPLVSLEVWTLRAEAAMQDGCDELARFCLDKAMEYGASKEAHATLARWLLGKGRREASRQALRILGAHGVR